MLNYDLLRLIWSFIIGILITGFVITDGFDMGVGILLYIIGKNNLERKIMINTIAPHWDGNQVWLVTAAGALFAAWPIVYATLFSSFYIAMIILLVSLFLRPVGFEYRSKIKNQIWEKICDLCISIGSIIPPIILGIAMGNILQGIPFYIDKYLQIHSEGSFIKLFNPFAILISITILLIFINQAATYLQMRIKDYNLNCRIYILIKISSVLLILFFILSFINAIFFIKGYKFYSILDNKIAFLPLKGNRILYENKAWISNFKNHVYLYIIPVLSVIFPLFTILSSIYKKLITAFIFSTLTIISMISTVGILMFPFIIPSSFIPQQSLTIWNSTSSQLTLNIMLYIAFIFMPIILTYTFWCYKKMFFPFSKKIIKKNPDSYY
ncbi:cytochrome d ubiquinol oxidase subunit II [Enterobacteriaceae endosymbiont of Donacia tomentosa]|uniref:cytochrome d ubiquinol oxidase subunit II n=1 Tax=Enterobacteriaceae endosymbiont of Donacia tomentosa TaxID=2675787 RepID=UPI00144A0ABF|nr:cytochrome d ubiquinol oxidase subunit II [Enterobacteriaceae endosymbiont of Donacia tomentosa]QJC31644.1 cytochrome d ubiquinol oxidase subunit II [Enterobacteriaceae endosymbiont of Donacia tomentosa]